MEITSNEIKIDRELSELDKFARDFCKILEKHTKYVIVSGYVSILLGRSRSSEDIDILVPVMDDFAWNKIYADLIKNDYYCINSEGSKDSYNCLNDGIAVRFAPEDVVLPNMEVLFAKEKVQKIALETAINVTIGKDNFIISNIELQIAYKEKVLKSPKDIEDARHLRMVLGKAINTQELKKYQAMLK